MEHLEKQEWADELQHITDDQVHPIDTKEVTKACKNPITKRCKKTRSIRPVNDD